MFLDFVSRVPVWDISVVYRRRGRCSEVENAKGVGLVVAGVGFGVEEALDEVTLYTSRIGMGRSEEGLCFHGMPMHKY